MKANRTERKLHHLDAVIHVNGLLKWCSDYEEFGSKYVSNLLDLRSQIVLCSTQQPKKQKPVTDFFTKQ